LKQKLPGAATAATTTSSSTKSSYPENIPKIDDIETATQLYGFYLEPNAGLLAQRRIAEMGILQTGVYDGKVGLLPGLSGDFMQNYEASEAIKEFMLFS
jgi:hypothetical protein